MKKIPQKLNGFKGHIDIEQGMSNIVWSSLSEEAFETNWNDFLIKYGLEGNKWLQESKGLAAILYRAFNKAYAEMVQFKAKDKEGKTIITHEEGSLNEMNDLHSPTRVRPRGRPKKRLGSTLKKQIASASNKKKRKALAEVNVGDENSRTFE
ncbi:hypothetical protein PIB30_067942 [Stylosanthes scabra]|uniref:Uncharacterized protein n=1 Tax=Stylosanthes scabra TaxID=79078 RepID=A0ABU6VL17_9FABA|nr:hypothetical protein [Stylosanthes scabra]